MIAEKSDFKLERLVEKNHCDNKRSEFNINALFLMKPKEQSRNDFTQSILGGYYLLFAPKNRISAPMVVVLCSDALWCKEHPRMFSKACPQHQLMFQLRPYLFFSLLLLRILF